MTTLAPKHSGNAAVWDRRFRRRVNAFHRGKIQLTDEESARYLAGEDPDLVLITDYLDGQLADDAAAAVEERLQTDLDFAGDFLPLLEIRHRASRPHYEDLLERSTVRRKWKRESRWGLVLLMALLTLVISILLTASIGGYLHNRAIAAQIATGVAPSSVIGGKVISAGDRDTVIGFLGLDMILRPHTTYTAKIFDHGGGWAALDGEAAFHSWGGALNIFTATSLIKFSAGRYAIRSIRHAGETRLVVDSGWAEVRRLPDLKLMRVLDSGTSAVIRPGALVTITNERQGYPLAAFTAPAGTHQDDTTADQRRFRNGARRVKNMTQLGDK